MAGDLTPGVVLGGKVVASLAGLLDDEAPLPTAGFAGAFEGPAGDNPVFFAPVVLILGAGAFRTGAKYEYLMIKYSTVKYSSKQQEVH